MALLDLAQNKMTIGDMEDFEEVTGTTLAKTLDTIQKAQKATDLDDESAALLEIPIKVIKALVWIEKRRTNPEFSLEDARNVSVTELRVMGAEEPPVPPRAVRRAAAKSTKKPSKPTSATRKR